jgi:hypothetical protein
VVASRAALLEGGSEAHYLTLSIFEFDPSFETAGATEEPLTVDWTEAGDSLDVPVDELAFSGDALREGDQLTFALDQQVDASEPPTCRSWVFVRARLRQLWPRY